MRRPLLLSLLLIAGLLFAMQACDSDEPSPAGVDAAAPNLDASSTGDALVATDASADTGTAADSSNDDAALDAGADAFSSTGALVFDGVNDIASVTVPDGGANEAAFSVETWFKTSSLTGTFFEVEGSGADRFLFLLNGKVCFYVYAPPNTATACSTTATYNDGVWHHAAGTLGGVGGTRVFVDGAPAGASALPVASTFTADTIFAIGYGHTGFLSAANYFHGELDDMRVWSVERSPAEIAANYKKTLAPMTAGLQAYWKLDETGSATKAVDSSGNGHDATLTNFTFTTSPWVGPGAF